MFTNFRNATHNVWSSNNYFQNTKVKENNQVVLSLHKCSCQHQQSQLKTQRTWVMNSNIVATSFCIGVIFFHFFLVTPCTRFNDSTRVTFFTQWLDLSNRHWLGTRVIVICTKYPNIWMTNPVRLHTNEWAFFASVVINIGANFLFFHAEVKQWLCFFVKFLKIWILKCPCVLLSPWHHFFKSCPWTKLQGLIVFLKSTCCMQMNLCVFFSVNCLTCVLFTGIYPIPV